MITPYTNEPENPGDLDLDLLAPDDRDYRDDLCPCGLPDYICTYLDTGEHGEPETAPESAEFPDLDSVDEWDRQEALKEDAGDLKYRWEIGD